jgi:hypothetical protein
MSVAAARCCLLPCPSGPCHQSQLSCLSANSSRQPRVLPVHPHPGVLTFIHLPSSTSLGMAATESGSDCPEVVKTAILHGKRDIRIEDRPPPAVRAALPLQRSQRRQQGSSSQCCPTCPTHSAPVCRRFPCAAAATAAVASFANQQVWPCSLAVSPSLPAPSCSRRT